MTVIKLNLKTLLESGEMQADEVQRLQALALPAKAQTAWITSLLIFGALAVASGVLLMNPQPITGLALALLSLTGAAVLKYGQSNPAWHALAAAFALMGTLGLCGWVSIEFGESSSASMVASTIFVLTTLSAVIYRSPFLSALAVLSLGAVLGSGTAYWHASYALFVEEPSVTIVIFGALCAGLYTLRAKAQAIWSEMVTMGARTAFFMVQFGFWVGSLWGDYLGDVWVNTASWQDRKTWQETAAQIPEAAFTLGWAAALIAIIFRAPKGGFLSNTSLVFLAIHLYTQFFETFHDSPLAVVIAGLSAIAIAVWATFYFTRQTRLA